MRYMPHFKLNEIKNHNLWAGFDRPYEVAFIVYPEMEFLITVDMGTNSRMEGVTELFS